MAAANNHALVVAALLSAGAATDVRNAAGNTPLLWAAHTGAAEAVRALLAAKADVNAVNAAGRSALDEVLALHASAPIASVVLGAGGRAGSDLRAAAADANASEAQADQLLHDIADDPEAQDAADDDDDALALDAAERDAQ